MNALAIAVGKTKVLNFCDYGGMWNVYIFTGMLLFVKNVLSGCLINYWKLVYLGDLVIIMAIPITITIRVKIIIITNQQKTI